MNLYYICDINPYKYNYNCYYKHPQRDERMTKNTSPASLEAGEVHYFISYFGASQSFFK